MFELKNQKAKLTHVNVRREFAGPKDGRAASDIKILVKSGNQILDKLSVNLRGCFYRFEESQQASLVGQEMTALIHPLLQSSFDYDYKGAGYRVLLGLVDDDNKAVEIKDCQINEFKITVQDGGSIVMVFRVQFHQEPGQIDNLTDKLMQDVVVTLIAPEIKPEVADLAGSKPSELAAAESRRAKKKGLPAPEPEPVDAAAALPEGATIN